jgi:hypothetical protein
LVPGLGHTIFTQPTLYWSISQPISSGEAIVTLKPTADPNSFDFPESLIEETFTLNAQAGIQALPLSQYKVKLEQDIEYEWSISLVCDPSNPSLNIFSTGRIKQIAPSAKLSQALKTASSKQLPHLYAENGIWYDSLDELSQSIQKKPSDKKLRKVRASLLKQGGLKSVAAFDM